jgi:glycine hydroxymethyltransferase
MPQLAAWMDEAIMAASKDDDEALGRVAGEVRDLLSAYPIPGWSPDV